MNTTNRSKNVITQVSFLASDRALTIELWKREGWIPVGNPIVVNPSGYPYGEKHIQAFGLI